jgi:large subunit ribosomal protein L13
MLRAKTFSQKPADVTRQWYLVDAKGQTLGRLATKVATYLAGKQKPTFTPHVDGGDYIVVINAADIVVTGKKEAQKVYYRHSGYPGGIKQRTFAEQRALEPEKIITEAVRGMLPKNKLSMERLKRLKVCAGPEHPHAPQQPTILEIGDSK